MKNYKRFLEKILETARMLNFDWCGSLSERWARFIVILAFFFPLIFALTMKHKYIFQGAQDQKKWRNLKYWVLLLVLIQICIYLYF